ncbi:MAG: hypothetical protein MUE44_36305 [Oscillatoriaceae cyanobacterium Prado104]|nr:hypothetical protein [Oscillatoriaceae cyanobacterium Prado104]
MVQYPSFIKQQKIYYHYQIHLLYKTNHVPNFTNAGRTSANCFTTSRREESCKNRGFAWFEVPVILGEAFRLNSDEIDVVKLNRCSQPIAHFISRDGILLYEQEAGEFEKFRKSHLMSDAELKELENQLLQNIQDSLKEWGLV